MHTTSKPDILSDPAVRYFAEALKAKISTNLCRLILFGSRARGDAKEYSDYDFVIIVNHNDKDVKEEIFEIKYEFLNKFDIPTCGLVYTPEEWSMRAKTPLGINVSREGIDVL